MLNSCLHLQAPGQRQHITSRPEHHSSPSVVPERVETSGPLFCCRNPTFPTKGAQFVVRTRLTLVGLTRFPDKGPDNAPDNWLLHSASSSPSDTSGRMVLRRKCKTLLDEPPILRRTVRVSRASSTDASRSLSWSLRLSVFSPTAKTSPASRPTSWTTRNAAV